MSNDITNLRDTIIAKSDQLNADDIIGGTITVTVTAVKRGDSAEQPVVIHYKGDNGRPYKPCKTMRRVLIAGWGENGSAWVGRSMALFNEPSVKFGGVAVGGIRISAMTDIGNGLTLTPNASKGKKQTVFIKPLMIAPPAPAAAAAKPADDRVEKFRAALTKKAGEGLAAIVDAWGKTPDDIKAALGGDFYKDITADITADVTEEE